MKPQNLFSLLILCLSYSTLALGESGINHQGKVTKEVITLHNSLVTQRFYKKIALYNKLRTEPQKMAAIEKDPKERKALQKFFKGHRMDRLPPIKVKGENAGFRLGSMLVKFSILDAYKNQIYINEHRYELPQGATLSELKDDLQKFLKTKLKTTSIQNPLLDLFIAQAFAQEEGFELTLGAVMALEIEADPENDEYDWGDGFFDNHNVEDAMKIVKAVKDKNQKCQSHIPNYGDPDPVFLSSGSETADLIHELGYYKEGSEKSEKLEKLKKMSKGLQEFLEDKYGKATNCEEMALGIFNINDPDNNLITNWLDREGTSLGRLERKNQKKAFAESFCTEANQLETCLAKFGVEKLRIHDGDRIGKPASIGSGSSGGGSKGSATKR